ncbi:hypothetical protein, partial [Sphingobium yanoikuyae]|uniref:hypothetical protein n=1 Tax=Sphingobium yanoikuyae TaxID=13690 RepID=UPI002FDDA4A8
LGNFQSPLLRRIARPMTALLSDADAARAAGHADWAEHMRSAAEALASLHMIEGGEVLANALDVVRQSFAEMSSGWSKH